MLSRVNCSKTVRNHYKTLRKFGSTSKRIYWKDLVLFIIIPVTTAIILAFLKIDLVNQITNLIAAISILGGFLFNLLAIIYNSMENLKKDIGVSEIKKTFAKEIHSNISYNILLAVFCIVILILYNIELPHFLYCEIFEYLISFLTYFSLISFFLTLLMVLNRIYILLDKNIT